MFMNMPSSTLELELKEDCRNIAQKCHSSIYIHDQYLCHYPWNSLVLTQKDFKNGIETFYCSMIEYKCACIDSESLENYSFDLYGLLLKHRGPLHLQLLL